MYKIMVCKDLNPLGEILEYDYSDIYSCKMFCVNFFSKQLDKFSAGFSVYELETDGSIGKTVANWQHDGKNCFNCMMEVA